MKAALSSVEALVSLGIRPSLCLDSLGGQPTSSEKGGGVSDNMPVESPGAEKSLAVERALDKTLITKVLISGAILFAAFIAVVSFL